MESPDNRPGRADDSYRAGDAVVGAKRCQEQPAAKQFFYACAMARMVFPRKEDSIMEHAFTIATLWLGLAVFSAVAAYHLRVSIALVEICVGVIVSAVAGHLGKADALDSN